VWINVNWLLIRGLREYYNPYSGEGLGGERFSWSAALVIDLLRRPAG